jgi:hypothetical protein
MASYESSSPSTDFAAGNTENPSVRFSMDSRKELQLLGLDWISLTSHARWKQFVPPPKMSFNAESSRSRKPAYNGILQTDLTFVNLFGQISLP